MRQELEFESDRVVQSSTTAMALDFSDSEDLYTISQTQTTTQVALQRVESRANTLDPENTTIEVDIRPIWPGRPELIYQAYLAKKKKTPG
jgi:hypothetical protein